ncbi:MAG: tetratricopeptide repeat protein [Candidatus Poribacteria bacterium]|nr:tetratricopeptide repeat protein [Candidatus Poribacteria bacterium]
MKVILTIGIVLGLLVTAAMAQVQIPAERLEEAFVLTPEEQEKNIEICTQNLIKLGQSIEAYLEVNGDYPEWLSDLYPKHLADANVLICPSDKEGGKPIYTPNTDPEMPVSYSYELNPRYREWKTEQRKVYGDAMPIVRCRHHANEDFVALNLSFSSRVYRSANTWEFQPEDMYESLEEAITTLAAGIQEHPDNENLVYVYPALVRLYMKVEREEDAENLINRYKEALKPDSIREHFVLGDMLEIMNRNEELLQLFTKLEELSPENRSVFRKLAEIHERLGNAELANEYRIKADPALALIGKPVPDFSPPQTLRALRSRLRNIGEKSSCSIFGQSGVVPVSRRCQPSKKSTTAIRTKDLILSALALTLMSNDYGIISKRTRFRGDRFSVGKAGRAQSLASTVFVRFLHRGLLIKMAR